MIAAALDLGDALSHIATGLRVPVLIAAVVVLLLCALEVGRFAFEWWRRFRNRHFDLAEVVAHAIEEPSHATYYAHYARNSITARAVIAIAGAPVAARGPATEHALADYELRVQRSLDRTRLLVRAGPAIGLMGTLIPLIPGLAALAGGDVATLANDLRDAFGATVVGLLVGTVAFALTLARTRMYTEDLAGLERGSAPQVSRIGLGRHRAIESDAGDPLDGLVNLFDVGMILAIAFLIAGLGLTLNPKSDKFEARQGAAPKTATARSKGNEKVIPDPASAPHAAGRGTPVGQVYRLPDGRLVYVKGGASPHR